MKVVFVYPDIIRQEDGWVGYFYEGLAVLSAVVREEGHDTAMIHVPHPLETDDLVAQVASLADGEDTLVAISSTTNQVGHAKTWAKGIKDELGLPIVMGGVHPTLNPEDAISAEGVDWICNGDGESVLRTLTRRLASGGPTDDIQGLWTRGTDGEVINNGHAPLADLDTLPLPHWEIYPHYAELEIIRDNVGVSMGSRGCAFDCSYCCNRALMDMARDQGQFLRFKDPEKHIRELETYLERYPKTWGFFFEDDIFGLKKGWLDAWRPLYTERIGKPFGCNMRPNLVTDDLVENLVAAGCIRVQLAIEAGDEDIRNRILNRRLSDDKLKAAFRAFQDRGVQTLSYNMVGAPDENARTMLATIKINADINPTMVQHSITYPYRGTELHSLCVDEGLMADREVEDYFTDTMLDLPTATRGEILFFQKNFAKIQGLYHRLYSMPRPIGAPLEKAADWFFTRRSVPKVLPALRRPFASSN